MGEHCHCHGSEKKQGKKGGGFFSDGFSDFFGKGLFIQICSPGGVFGFDFAAVVPAVLLEEHLSTGVSAVAHHFQLLR